MGTPKSDMHPDRNEGRGRRRSLWKVPAFLGLFVAATLRLASQFVDGWHWQPGAFVVVGALVFTVGFIYQVVTRNRDEIAYRGAVGVAFVTAFCLLWSNLVQMFDVNPAAGMYFGVPIVGIIGAAMARLRPEGMARALFATALAQVTVWAMVLGMLIARKPQLTTWTPAECRSFVGNAVLAMLFAGSGWLFGKAARSESAPKVAGP